jgi:hypothetical protein
MTMRALVKAVVAITSPPSLAVDSCVLMVRTGSDRFKLELHFSDRTLRRPAPDRSTARRRIGCAPQSP